MLNKLGFTLWKMMGAPAWSEADKEARKKVDPRTCTVEEWDKIRHGKEPKKKDDKQSTGRGGGSGVSVFWPHSLPATSSPKLA